MIKLFSSVGILKRKFIGTLSGDLIPEFLPPDSICICNTVGSELPGSRPERRKRTF